MIILSLNPCIYIKYRRKINPFIKLDFIITGQSRITGMDISCYENVFMIYVYSKKYNKWLLINTRMLLGFIL